MHCPNFTQVLTMVNPAIFYRTADGHEEGVGVRIKKLLEMLDTIGVEHIPESLLRDMIRSRTACKAKATQFFLRSGTDHTVIKRGSDSVAMGCVCIPYQDIPDEFFDNLDDG